MEYKIGEVSKIINISKEMIRYYEKKGVLTPSRVNDNNYRTYSTMDIFLLMEIVRYQALDYNMNQINDLLSDHYMNKYFTYLDDYYNQLQDEITQKTILSRRVKELSERAKSSYLNIGNYWIKEIPEHDLFYMLEAHGDDYGKMELNEESKKILFYERYMPYFESTVIFEKEKETWWYAIQHDYTRKLLPDLIFEKKLEKQYCLCTMIDMGEIGEFNRKLLDPVYQYIQDKGYIINGDPRGMIVCRGYENHKFQRIIEIQIPIQI